MSSKLFILMKREYMTRVHTRGFVFFTILIPVLIAGMILIEVKIATSAGAQQQHLAVVDLSGQLLPQLQSVLDEKLANGAPKYWITPVAATPDTLTEVEAKLHRDVMAGVEDAYLVIPADVLVSHQAEYHTRNPGALAEYESMHDQIDNAVMRASLNQEGFSGAQIALLFKPFDLQQLRVGNSGDRNDRGQSVAFGWLLGMLLYVTLILYGVTVMRGVAAEKANRISEILLSSADAFTLMLGKILGIAGMGLTQYLIWGICLAAAGAYGLVYANAATGGEIARMLPHVGAKLYISFVLFFLFGFLVYASLYAAIGAMVSSEQEAQQAQLPVTMLLVIGLFSASAVLNNPNGAVPVVMSMIPFFAPILMVMREAISNPPMWQLVLSLLLCLGTLLALIKVTAKIYRVGILMTGKRPTLPELVKWLRYS